MTEGSRWQPSLITTIDGREVLSDSEEWRLCCEAVHVLRIPHHQRNELLRGMRAKRGDAGVLALEAEITRVEPAFLLAMSGKEARRSYLDQTERHEGKFARAELEKRIVALWEQRKAASEAAA